MSAATPRAGDDRGTARLLYLLDIAGRGGGAERIAVLVLEQLDPRRFERTICLTRHGEPEALAELEQHGVEVLLLNRRGRYDIAPWLKLIALARKRHFHVIHSHKHGSNVWGAILSTMLRIPIFFAHEHSWPYSGNRKRVWIDRLIARRATKMIAVSQADREAMVRVEKIDPSSILVLPNAIPDPTPGDVDALRAELGLAPGALVVTCVGARPEKRIDRVLHAVDAVRHAHPDLHVLIVGRSKTLAELEQLADRLSLNGVVHFLGFREDISTLLQLTDVALIASDREGSPLAVLEYMAAGCAIVATRVGGIPEMVRDGEEALLVEPGDVEGLARALETVLGDAAERARLGSAAKERQRTEFSLGQLVAKTETLYRDTLGTGAA